MKREKLLKAAGLVLLIVVIAMAGKHLYDLSFEGDAKIKLIANGGKIMTLEDLINNDNFRNSVLYIDLWGTRCGPCIQEFSYVSSLKERYKDKPVKFIYLSVRYGHMLDEKNWKNMIQKYDLSGYHLLMNNDFYYNIWKYEGIENSFMIPHYILIDKKGKINEINAARPSAGEKLYCQIDKLLEPE